MVSLGAVPLGCGFVCACVQQDAPDGFVWVVFFFLSKVLILFDGALIMWQILILCGRSFRLSCYKAKTPGKPSVISSENRAGAQVLDGWVGFGA